MTKKDAARAIIVNKNGKVLLGERQRGHFKGCWNLIGGSFEKGETAEECVLREVFEEIKVIFKNPVLWKDIPVEKSILGEYWHLYFFTGKIEGIPEPKKDEVSELGYFGLGDLDKIDIAFNHREVLIEFFRFHPKGV